MFKKINYFIGMVLFLITSYVYAEGMYINAFGGMGLLPENTVKFNQAGAAANPQTNGDIKIQTEMGWHAGVGIGADLSDMIAEGFTSDIEFRYLSNGGKEANMPILAAAGASVLGAVEIKDAKWDSMSYMLNVNYNINMLNSPVVPYLSLGAGMVNGELKSSPENMPNLKATSFGMQGKVGLTYPVNDAIDMFIDYTYLHSFEASYSQRWLSLLPIGLVAGQAPEGEYDFKWTSDYHIFGVGIRFHV